MPLSYRSRHELVDKLIEIGLSAPAVDELLDSLPSSSYDAPITRTQLEAANRTSECRATERLAETEKRLNERIGSTEKRLNERIGSTEERLTKFQRERFEESMSFQGTFNAMAPILLAFVAFLAILALCVAARADKDRVDPSEESRGAAPLIEVASTAATSTAPHLRA